MYDLKLYYPILIVLSIILIWELCKYISFNFYHQGFYKILGDKKDPPNIFKDYLYFDANATTPMYMDSLKAYNKTIYLGNASTNYSDELGTTQFMKLAQIYVLKTAGFDFDSSGQNHHTVIFNSGASEGNSYIIRTIADQFVQPHIITSSYEHKSILLCLDDLVKRRLIDVTYVSPNHYGLIDPIQIAESIKPNTKLISIMHVNNETGSINPIHDIGLIAKKNNILFHVDAAQSFGKLKTNISDNNIDILTASMHKIYGPIGVGVMVLSPKIIRMHQAQISGTQYGGLRGGTENVAGIIASVQSMKYINHDRFNKNLTNYKQKLQIVSALTDEFGMDSFDRFYGKGDSYIPFDFDSGRFQNQTPKIKIIVLGPVDLKTGYPSPTESSPNTLLLSICKFGNYDLSDRFCNIKLKQSLFKKGVIISIGSACNTHATGPSHVLTSIKAPFVIRSGTIRLSLMDQTPQEHISMLIKHLKESIYEQI